MVEESTCPRCGNPFIKGNGNQKFCSIRCLIDNHNAKVSEAVRPKEKALCAVCQSQFQPFNRRTKFCSAKCRMDSIYAKQRAATRQVLPPELNCKHCKRVFQPKNRTNVYCSYECSSAHAEMHDLRRSLFNNLRRNSSSAYWEDPDL